MPSAKSLGKRRAVDLSSDEEVDELSAEGSSSSRRSRQNKRSRVLSPVDPSNILEPPPESPERAGAAPALSQTREQEELEEDEDEDEVIVVRNHRGAGPSMATSSTQEVFPLHRHQPPVPLPASQESNSQYESAPFYRMNCPICMDPPKPMVVTNCGHAFCGDCLFSALAAQTNVDTYMAAYDPVLRNNILKASQGKLVNGTCPVCRKPIKGGWGTAARGLEWKTEKKKKKKVEAG